MNVLFRYSRTPSYGECQDYMSEQGLRFDTHGKVNIPLWEKHHSEVGYTCNFIATTFFSVTTRDCDSDNENVSSL